MPRAQKYKERGHLMIKLIAEVYKFWRSRAGICPWARDPAFSSTEYQGVGALPEETQSRTEGWNVPGVYDLLCPCSLRLQLVLELARRAYASCCSFWATGHLSSPLLFFPDQVTYPGRIRPRLCTLHSFLISFFFSMPGGSWTVSSLACKCICASSVQ